MDLLFLTDISQLESVTRKTPQWLENTRIVTGDLTVAAALERLDIPFIDEWDYLEDADVERNYNIAHELQEHWWNDNWGELNYHGFSLADAAKRDVVSPFQAALNARVVYERLLRSYPVNHIYGFFLQPEAIVRSGPAPGFRTATSVAHAVLHWLAQEAGLPVTGLKSSRPLAPQSRRWTARKPLVVRSPIPQSENHNRSALSRVVVFVSYYMRSQERDEIEKRFACEPGWRVVNLSYWDLRPGGSLWGPWNQTEWRQQLQMAWNGFEASQATYSGPYPEIFGNPHLSFQFELIWNQMLTAAQLGESFDVLLGALRPSLVVLGVDCFAFDRTFERLAGKRGIPTAAIFEGGFRPMFGYRELMGEADYVMVWGKQDVQHLPTYRMNEVKLRQVGSLKYGERYSSMPLVSESNDRRRNTVEAKRSLGFPTDKPVIALLTASINSGMVLPIAKPREHRATWRAIAALAERRSDMTFVIKPHPTADHFEFYRDLCRDAPPNLIFSEYADLDAVLTASDLAVLVNYCTTAALEAMLNQIPVVFLRTAVYQLADWQDSLKEHGAILTGSVAQMEAVLDRLLQNDVFRRDALSDAEVALAWVLGDRGASPLDRIMTKFCEIALPPTSEQDHPGQCVSHDIEQQVKDKLAEGTQCLLNGGSHDELASIGKSLAKLLKNAPQRAFLTERVRFGLSFFIGYAAKNPAEVRRLMRACFDAFDDDLDMPAEDNRRIRMNAYLTSIIRHTDAGNIATARTFIRQSLFELPGQAVRSGPLRRLLLQNFIYHHRPTLSLMNMLEWLARRLYEKRPAGYLEINSRKNGERAEIGAVSQA